MANSIGKYRKATEAEQHAWGTEPMPDHPNLKANLYELRGFITCNGMELAVEKTGDGAFEVHAPPERHFAEGLHTLLCDDMPDLRERLRSYDLEPCGEECRA